MARGASTLRPVLRSSLPANATPSSFPSYQQVQQPAPVQKQDTSVNGAYWAQYQVESRLLQRQAPKAADRSAVPKTAAAAVGASNQKDNESYRIGDKVKGLAYDFAHFDEIVPPDGDLSFANKVRYIATRDDRCGVSVGGGILLFILFAAALTLIGYAVYRSMQGQRTHQTPYSSADSTFQPRRQIYNNYNGNAYNRGENFAQSFQPRAQF
jgi:hypothetical protein